MSKKSLIPSALVLLACLTPNEGQAREIFIPLQGYLTDAAGNPLTACTNDPGDPPAPAGCVDVYMEVRFQWFNYDGSTRLAVQQVPDLYLVNGFFEVRGYTSGWESQWFADAERAIFEIQFNGEILGPFDVGFVPYAAVALHAGGTLESRLVELETRLADLENRLKYVHLEVLDGVESMVVEGTNLHVRNALGGTANTDGRGNLIVGFAEHGISTRPRGGSHNLVVGQYHGWSTDAHSGLLVGRSNLISAPSTTAIGEGNKATADYASVCGGQENEASGQGAAISGGYYGIASGLRASISGGRSNRASGQESAVSGGDTNRTWGEASVVVGGGCERGGWRSRGRHRRCRQCPADALITVVGEASPSPRPQRYAAVRGRATSSG